MVGLTRARLSHTQRRARVAVPARTGAGLDRSPRDGGEQNGSGWTTTNQEGKA
ncbi:Protein of unknown function [Propionibacterium freudenreichii]|nr:Protein of unknown function [Propionibacterium freudenreichii]